MYKVVVVLELNCNVNWLTYVPTGRVDGLALRMLAGYDEVDVVIKVYFY